MCGCLGGTYLWAGRVLGGREGYGRLGGNYLRAGWSLTGQEGVWAVLTSGLGGLWLGGTYLGTGRALRGRYLPPGWAASDWAGLRLAASTCVPWSATENISASVQQPTSAESGARTLQNKTGRKVGVELRGDSEDQPPHSTKHKYVR